MAYSGPIREEIVSSVEIPDHPIRCPRCKGATVVLYGSIQFPYTAWLVNGEDVKSEQGNETSLQIVEAIECETCKVKYRLYSPRECELQALVSDLTDRLAQLGGAAKAC